MLPTPTLPLSARIAAGFLIALLLLTITGLVIPEHLPRLLKEIVCFAWMLPGAPLLVVLANDMAQLRKLRLLLRHATEVPKPVVAPALEPARPVTGDEDEEHDEDDIDDGPDIVIDEEGVAADLIARWRAWRWWLLGIAALTGAVALVFGKVWMALAIYLLAPAVLRELYLAINALESATAKTWQTLHPLERALARTYSALLGLAMLAGMLGMAGWIGYLIFVEPSRFHFRPGHIGVALMWVLALGAGAHFVRRMGWMAVRRATAVAPREDALP
jgi:hypothetical protein